MEWTDLERATIQPGHPKIPYPILRTTGARFIWCPRCLVVRGTLGTSTTLLLSPQTRWWANHGGWTWTWTAGNSSSCVFAPMLRIFSCFLLLSDSQTIMVAARMGEAATHKFLAAVVSPLWEGSVTRDLFCCTLKVNKTLSQLNNVFVTCVRPTKIHINVQNGVLWLKKIVLTGLLDYERMKT